MKLIKMNGPYCLVASAAMLLETTIEQLHKEIGHDGTEIWWPPAHMRGVHIQEIQECFLRRGSCLYPFTPVPEIAPDLDTEPKPLPERHLALNHHLAGRWAILIIEGHAMAWDGSFVYDPRGKISVLDFNVLEAWIVGRLLI